MARARMKNFMLRDKLLGLKRLQKSDEFTWKCSLFYKELGEKEIMTNVANSYSEYWGTDTLKTEIL